MSLLLIFGLLVACDGQPADIPNGFPSCDIRSSPLDPDSLASARSEAVVPDQASLVPGTTSVPTAVPKRWRVWTLDLFFTGDGFLVERDASPEESDCVSSYTLGVEGVVMLDDGVPVAIVSGSMEWPVTSPQEPELVITGWVPEVDVVNRNHLVEAAAARSALDELGLATFQEHRPELVKSLGDPSAWAAWIALDRGLARVDVKFQSESASFWGPALSASFE